MGEVIGFGVLVQYLSSKGFEVRDHVMDNEEAAHAVINASWYDMETSVLNRSRCAARNL